MADLSGSISMGVTLEGTLTTVNLSSGDIVIGSNISGQIVGGPPGPPGDAATLDVGTTTTGAAGTDALVANSGTTSEAIFDFTIPRGDKGDTGDTGATGPASAWGTIPGTLSDQTDLNTALTDRVLKAGDTMTGTLNLPSNGLVVGTNQMVVSGGNVGVGTIAPAAQLDVSSATGGTLRLSRDDTGAIAEDEWGKIEFYGNDASTNGTNIHAKIAGVAQSVSIDFGNLAFYTRQAATLGERMRIDSVGNVGIGTASIDARLDVVASSGILADFNRSSTSNQLLINGGSGFLQVTTNNNSEPALYVKGTGTADLVNVFDNTTEVFTILDGGNVGIGLIAPNTPLHVQKNAAGNIIIGEFSNVNGATDDAVSIKMIAGNPSAGELGTILTHQRQGASGGDFFIKTNPTLAGTPVERFRITKDGNIGIGETVPTSRLHVFESTSSGTVPVLRILGTSSSGDYTNLASFATGGGTGGIRLSQHSGGANALHTWSQWDATDNRWEAPTTTTVGSTQTLYGIDGSIQFKTQAQAAVTSGDALIYNDTLTLLGSGNVGIGMTGASYRLYISEAGGSTGTFIGHENSSVAGATNKVMFDHRLNSDSTMRTFFRLNTTSNTITDATRNSLVEFQTNNAGTFATAMAINGSNVGIGTIAPGAKLNIKENTTTAEASQLRLDNSGTSGNQVALDFFTSSTTATTSVRTGRIYGIWDGSSYADSRLTLQSMANGNVLTDTLTLKNGSVGIGITAPSFKLSISDDGTTQSGFSRIGASALTQIQVPQATNETFRVTYGNFSTAAFELFSTGGFSAPWFRVQKGGSSYLNTTGNFGIGTNAPITKLSNGATLNTGAVSTSAINWQITEAAKYVASFKNSTGKGLHVEAAAADAGLVVETGKVGIGTTSPDANSLLHLKSTDSGSRYILMESTSSAANAAPGIIIRNDAAVDLTLQKFGSAATVTWDGITINNYGRIRTNGAGAGLIITTGAASTNILFGINDDEVARFDANGRLGLGVTSPTAVLHLKASTATAGTASFKINSGTLLTTPEAGVLEFNGTNFYLTPSATRLKIPLAPTSPSAYTPINVTTDRAYDSDATTTDELADVLGTLIADLQATGIIG